MGLFDTIRAELKCTDCQQIKEREIQTKEGPCFMEIYYTGDTIEPLALIPQQFFLLNCARRFSIK